MPSLFKECVICKEPRNAETEYHFNGARYKDGSRKKRLDCVYCCRARRSAYFQDPQKRARIKERIRINYNSDGGIRRGKNRKYALWNLYGLTVEKYDEMRQMQNFSCAICETHESKTPRGKLYVDHCHESGKVRGLLCAKCNSALGYFEEDVSRMERAAEFLRMMKNKKPRIKSHGDNSSEWSKPRVTLAPS